MIGIIDYRMGNIRSVANAFRYIGEEVKIVTTPQEIEAVDKVVLPGVGAFGQGMENLKQQDLLNTLNSEVCDKKKPFLGICLGMQLICQESFEFGRFPGLGWIKASVRRFRADLNLRIPHVGWNNLIVTDSTGVLHASDHGKDVYFVHSYCVDAVNEDFVAAVCEYGYPFVAAIAKDNIFATQFHPEKSQQAGLTILKRFAEINIPCLKDA